MNTLIYMNALVADTKEPMSLDMAMASSGIVGKMIVVKANTIPKDLRLKVHRRAGGRGRGWFEIWLPKNGCPYGCKVYARRRGFRMEYGVFHSTSYGHPRGK